MFKNNACILRKYPLIMLCVVLLLITIPVVPAFAYSIDRFAYLPEDKLLMDDTLTAEKGSLFEHNFDQNTAEQEIFIQRDQEIELTVENEQYQPGMNVPVVIPNKGFMTPIIILDENYDGTVEEAQRNQLMQIQPLAAATPSLTIVSTTATSVTLNCVFPTSGASGNVLGYWDFNQGETIWNDNYGNNYYRTNGTITISGLVPGGLYQFALMWSTDGGINSGYNNSICRRVQLPYSSTTISWARSDGSYVFTNIEAADRNLASSSSFNTWPNRMDNAYLAYKDLTGHAPYSKIEIKSSRTRDGFNLPDGQNHWFEILGWSGNPAYIYIAPFIEV